MSKTRYEVTGTTAFQGHQPGEQFDADLDEAQERRALERGSIRRVKATAKPQSEQEASDG